MNQPMICFAHVIVHLECQCLYSCMLSIAIVVLCLLTVLLFNIPLSLFLLC